MDKNTGLWHNLCHDMFDNKPHEAKKYLENFDKILDEIKEIDGDYYNQYIMNLDKS